jgi:membrane protease YdiL (CAAX protease family)
MLENELKSRPERHPFINLVLILLFVGLGFVFVGPMIGFFAALPFYEGSMTDMITNVQDAANHPELKIPLYIVQAFATLVGLILAPAAFMVGNRTSITTFFRNQNTQWIPVIVTAFVVIVFMAVNSIFIEWNAGFQFPEFAKNFEAWARDRENEATQLTEFLTKFDSTGELILALVVIAVLPAIGEELVFRGLIQNELFRGTKNIHVAIWVSAILFSAIHLQFFGFLPRLLLGALFGYLYYWSGNLTLAMVAHFVNNGVSVVAMYFYQRGAFEFDLETPEAAPANLVIISALLTGGLLYYFYKYFEHRKPSIPNA